MRRWALVSLLAALPLPGWALAAGRPPVPEVSPSGTASPLPASPAAAPLGPAGVAASSPAPPAPVFRAVVDEALRARITEAWPLGWVRAGSGLSWFLGRLLVVQDDAFSFALVDPATRAATSFPAATIGPPLSKDDKPDYEASFATPDGAVFVVGSGSKPSRRQVARVQVREPPLRVSRLDDLYAGLEARLGATPNIEGAVRLGSTVRLLHRGLGRGARSATLDVGMEALDGAPPVFGEARTYDLGTLSGVPLAFSDAAALGPERMVYLAVAEDAPDAVADGPVVGSAVGVVDAAGARWAPLLEADGKPSRRKLEGLVLDPDGQAAWAVTDPDDASLPSELCRIELQGPW